jgi:hypothetical protein
MWQTMYTTAEFSYIRPRDCSFRHHLYLFNGHWRMSSQGLNGRNIMLAIHLHILDRCAPCKIWGFHGGNYEECRLLGCGAVYILCEPIFRVEVCSCNLQSATTCSHWFLALGFFYPEDGGDTFLRNVGSHKIYMALHPRRWHSSGLLQVTNRLCMEPYRGKIPLPLSSVKLCRIHSQS